MFPADGLISGATVLQGGVRPLAFGGLAGRDASDIGMLLTVCGLYTSVPGGFAAKLRVAKNVPVKQRAAAGSGCNLKHENREAETFRMMSLILLLILIRLSGAKRPYGADVYF